MKKGGDHRVPETIRLEIDDRRLVQMIKKTGGKEPVRIVADGVEYGHFIEFGTTKMPERPCAMPAREAVRPGFIAAWKQMKSLEGKTKVVEKTAFDLQRLWIQNIERVHAVDTGAYVNSIHVVGGDWTVIEFESRRT